LTSKLNKTRKNFEEYKVEAEAELAAERADRNGPLDALKAKLEETERQLASILATKFNAQEKSTETAPLPTRRAKIQTEINLTNFVKKAYKIVKDTNPELIARRKRVSSGQVSDRSGKNSEEAVKVS